MLCTSAVQRYVAIRHGWAEGSETTISPEEVEGNINRFLFFSAPVGRYKRERQDVRSKKRPSPTWLCREGISAKGGGEGDSFSPPSSGCLRPHRGGGADPGKKDGGGKRGEGRGGKVGMVPEGRMGSESEQQQ